MPATDTLNISTRRQGTTVIVALAGSASMEHCEQLATQLLQACETKPPALVVDLTALEFICSLGLGGIVAAYIRMQRHGGKLVLAAPGGAIRDMLTVTKLGTLLKVHATVEQALDAAR